MANSKRTLFLKRRLRVRNKLRKINAGRLRLSVHRSNKNISAQLIDDTRGVTLAAASTMEKDLGAAGNNNVDAAARVGTTIAERARKAGVEDCYFDRGGFLFHGKVKALAEAAREAGLASSKETTIWQEMTTAATVATATRRRNSPIVWWRSTGCRKPSRAVSASASRRWSSWATRRGAWASARARPRKCPRRSARRPSRPSAA